MMKGIGMSAIGGFLKFRLVVGLLLVYGLCAAADAALIVMTSGEEIVCEIIEERADHFVIDHDGYRRYLLKDNVRRVDRVVRVPDNPSPLYHPSVTVLGGLYANLDEQDMDLRGVRAAYTHPVHPNVALELGLHYTDATIHDDKGSKLLPGDASWYGGTISALWNTEVRGTYAFLETGVGYFGIDHTMTPGEDSFLLAFYRLDGIIPEGQDGAYRQDPENAVGLLFGAGLCVPLTRRLVAEGRLTVFVLDSKNRGIFSWEPIPGDAQYESGQHVNTSELFTQTARFNLGLRWVF